MSDFSGSTAAQNNLNQSQAFAAALQRAKQIAAKIQPNQQQSNNVGGGGGGGFKRSHDDSEGGPETKRFTSPDVNDYGHNSNSNMSAGRGSNETVAHIQGDSGCKIQLGQEGDRVLTLRGSRDSVTKGRELIQQLANRNGGGNVEVVLTINMPPPGPTGYPPYQEIMIPGTKVGLVIGKGGDTIKQLQEKTGAKMVIIQDGPNQEVIKPLRISGDPQKIEHAKQLVLDLIAQKDALQQQQNSNRPGLGTNNGPNGGYNNFGGGGGEQCEVFVPKIAVGVVIGKGGDMIRKIQTECGCKLQFIQGKNDEPGDRRCLIQGTRQQVEDAKRTIDGLIENVMQRNRNGNGGGAGGAIPGNGGADNGNSNYGYGYGVNHAQQPAREEITFMIPASKCGIVIGRGGETIKLINQQSGAYCEMDRNAVNPPSEKLFKCKGTSEQVEAARQMIAEKINMDLNIISRKSIAGGPPNIQGSAGGYNPNDPNSAMAAYQQQWAGYAQQGAWGDQSQQAGMAQGAPGAGGQQADYSQQWIIYYKSIGMHREAEMIEQQLKAKQVGTGQAQPQQAANNAVNNPVAGVPGSAAQTQDYSAQWAEYYRSIGKIEEAEAIEKQMKANNAAPANISPATGGGVCAGNAPVSAAAAAAAAGSVNVTGTTNSNAAVGSQSKDYSAQWVKYYRSIGKHEEADNLEKQIKDKQQGIPGNSAGRPSGNAVANNPVNTQAGVSGAASSGYADYSQYSQYYAAAAAQGGYAQAGMAAGGYGGPQPSYPGAPQPPGSDANNPQVTNQKKNDKH
ncbi:far upstream element-binding protein 3 isoform X2 [Glossina fuscipes]|uniref:Far upstream element-binding protein 3 isoform X2 n=1 Tax=Glossina fuscipes TaxID=7396 RepID=A0A9C5YVA3_9MUSC|nr:far upstream element-binding protein 3 isoform X2 [Glossina fuscipes]